MKGDTRILDLFLLFRMSKEEIIGLINEKQPVVFVSGEHTMRDIAGHVHIPAEMELATTKSIMSINMRLIVFGNTVHTGRRKLNNGRKKY